MFPGYITDVEGIKVGHAQSDEGMTGVTVIMYEEGAVPGVDVRGSAPGTRETDIFRAENLVDKVHAIVLSGGSAFGLEASSGVMEYLEKRGIGFDVGITKVPIVSQAVLFDLNVGDYKIRPDKAMGILAASNASINENKQGIVGAGTGATVGKILGNNYSMKSGIGSASMKVGDLVVAAIVAVNAMGDVSDMAGNIIAGCRNPENGEFLETVKIIEQGENISFKSENTTIGVIATNGIITKPEGNKIAQVAHDAFARRIRPVHTMVDGDTIFTMSTSKVKANINTISVLAVECMERAIINSILSLNKHHK